MPTQIYHVTPTPTNLVSELSLTAGDPYMLQVTDPSPSPSVVRLHEAATAPDPSDGGHVLQNLAFVGITPRTGEGLWCWAEGQGHSVIVVTEAA